MDRYHEDAVKIRAYEIWEEEGRPEGKHEEHWRRALNENVGGPGTTSSKHAEPAVPISGKPETIKLQ